MQPIVLKLCQSHYLRILAILDINQAEIESCEKNFKTLNEDCKKFSNEETYPSEDLKLGIEVRKYWKQGNKLGVKKLEEGFRIEESRPRVIGLGL